MVLNLLQIECVENYSYGGVATEKLRSIRRELYMARGTHRQVRLTDPDVIAAAKEAITRGQHEDYYLGPLYLQHCL